jgi:ABC-type Mn2+/Zn2+ transport system ATPase subunit
MPRDCRPPRADLPSGVTRRLEEPPVDEPVLLLRDADLGYGRTPVLTGLSVTVEPGRFVGVVGPSGSGKTTLLRALLGEAAVLGGTVRVEGTVGRWPPAAPRLRPAARPRRLGLPRDRRAGRAARARRDLGPPPWFSRAERRHAAALLERLGLGGLGGRPISALSGGQQQRMFLARALVHDADLLLLDEPTSGVDLRTRHEILHLLGELRADGITVVLTTHDLNWVAAHLPRVVCLNGVVTADGPPTEVFTPEVLRATYGADVRVIRDGNLVFVADQTHVFDDPLGPLRGRDGGMSWLLEPFAYGFFLRALTPASWSARCAGPSASSSSCGA